MMSHHEERPGGPADDPTTAGSGQPQVQPPSQPQYADRVYRSMSAVCAGVVLLALAVWLGGDAIVHGTGHTPWLAMAGLLLLVPLIVAFTLRPAVYAGAERIRIRNPFRTVTLPWSAVDRVRSSFSTELFAGGRKFQLWAIPVSLRSRKRAARQTARAARPPRDDPFGASPLRRRGPARPGANGDEILAWADQAVTELRELSDRHPVPAPDDGDTPRPGPTVRWCYEILAPSAAGAVVLIVLLAIGG
jgi:hypothetical protein